MSRSRIQRLFWILQIMRIKVIKPAKLRIKRQSRKVRKLLKVSVLLGNILNQYQMIKVQKSLAKIKLKTNRIKRFNHQD